MLFYFLLACLIPAIISNLIFKRWWVALICSSPIGFYLEWFVLKDYVSKNDPLYFEHVIFTLLLAIVIPLSYIVIVNLIKGSKSHA